MPTEKAETEFKKFTARLLAAEETVHRRGEVALYSPEALQKILGKYCDIVAEEFDAQSCTIQLKLHDIGSCKFIQGLTTERFVPISKEPTPAQIYQERIAKDFQARWQEANGIIGGPAAAKEATDETRRRHSILRSPNAFPFCIYPKGAMWLAAANTDSPWGPFVDWLITDLQKGVTAEIVQEKSARERDPFNMRKTRSYRKLGDVDPYLWTNERSPEIPRYFFNYYAIPIRIHSGGDVVGVLKIENKGFANGEDPQTTSSRHRRQLKNVLALQSANFEKMLHSLAEALEVVEIGATEGGASVPEQSLLSLAYLAYDLSKCKSPDGSIESLLTAPYLASATCELQAETPPIQIFFDSMEDENDFIALLKPPNRPHTRLTKVAAFYGKLNARIARKTRAATLRELLAKAISALLQPGTKNVDVGPLEGGTFPDFIYPVALTGTGQETAKKLRFHVQVCPSANDAADAERLQRWWGLSPPRARAYEHRQIEKNEEAGLSGEYRFNTDRIIHLPTDRLAARVQALTYALSVPVFSKEDAWKLSWCGLEIGKLIERQISYRGTHTAPTVPLTADDFFRMPISDLSFVDTVRTQHENAHAAEKVLGYHMPNLYRDLGFKWGVTHTQRVKELRSYFDRIGQSYRAQYDALVAVWSYVFSRKLTTEQMGALRQRYPELATLLTKLAARFRELWSQSDASRSQRFKRWDGSLSSLLLDIRVFPDMKFCAPALDLEDGTRRDKALLCLKENLANCPNGVKNTSEELSPDDLETLLYRRYDTFVTLAVSLYLQLCNQKLRPDYLAFYRDCRSIIADLRDQLEASEEQATRAPQQGKAGGIGEFAEALADFRVQVLSLSTDDLAGILGLPPKPDAVEYLRFSVQGVYKRIRTLANVSGDQLTPAILNWESGRFDYLGSRFTCLFKNQVFAIYEDIWKRGDPFPAGERAARDGQPQPQWLCLRTKVHTGTDGYNAWQVVGLMDPLAVSDDQRDDHAYTLNALREMLAKADGKWQGDTNKIQYRRLARVRAALQKQYCHWFRYATKVLDQAASPPKPSSPLFGQYLGETALDVLVHLLRCDSKVNGANAVVQWSDLQAIVNALEVFTLRALKYSADVLPVILGMAEENWLPAPELLAAGNGLYDLMRALNGRCKAVAQSATFQKQLEDFETQLGEDKALFTAGAPQPSAPIVYVSANIARRVEDLKKWVGIMPESPENARSGRDLLDKIVREIQGSQMDYLFELPELLDGAEAPPLRGQNDVMDRIVCYILLHSSTRGSDEPDAYNLFYYLMSLMPVEFQVRTAFANTMAEQYHKIYKVGSDQPNRTLIPRERLKGIGKELDAMDRELEVQFEDYIDQAQ